MWLHIETLIEVSPMRVYIFRYVARREYVWENCFFFVCVFEYSACYFVAACCSVRKRARWEANDLGRKLNDFCNFIVHIFYGLIAGIDIVRRSEVIIADEIRNDARKRGKNGMNWDGEWGKEKTGGQICAETWSEKGEVDEKYTGEVEVQ